MRRCGGLLSTSPRAAAPCPTRGRPRRPAPRTREEGGRRLAPDQEGRPRQAILPTRRGWLGAMPFVCSRDFLSLSLRCTVCITYSHVSTTEHSTRGRWPITTHGMTSPKETRGGTGGGPVHRRPHAGSRVAITITVILRDGCSRHAHVNGGDDAAVKPAREERQWLSVWHRHGTVVVGAERRTA